MRRTTSLGAALASTGIVVAGLALWPTVAGADSDKNRDRSRAVVTGTFESNRDAEAFIDNDRNRQVSFGDELVYTNSAKGVFGAATDYGHCVFHQVDLKAATATLHCTATSTGRRGSLALQGTTRIGLTPPTTPPRLLEPSRWAITGGSGEFYKARGDVRITRFRGVGLDFRSSGTVRVVLRP